MNFPMVSLSEIAKPTYRDVQVIPGQSYRTIGVKWWGEGAYERETIDGSQTAAKTLSLVRSGDLIINKIWVRHGSTAIATDSVDGCAASGEFPTFELDQSQVLPRWIHWQTKTKDFWSKCDNLSRGTSGKNRIKPELFLTIKIPLPPLLEQRRIVAQLEELAAKIEEARSLRQQTTAETDRLLITTAHRSDLDQQTKIRAGWTEVAIGDVVREVAEAHTVKPDESYPNLGIYSFGRGLFHKPPIQGLATSANKLYRVQAGQFIYSRLFAFEGSYGWVSDDYDGHFVSGEYPTFDCDPDRIKAQFLYAYFKSPTIWKQVAVGSVGLGDRRQRVKAEQVLAHRLLLPPLEWQNRICEVMKKMNHLKTLQTETAAELDALLPSILDKAFKGEL